MSNINGEFISPLIFSLHTKTFFEKGMFFSPYVYSVDSLLENIG